MGPYPNIISILTLPIIHVFAFCFVVASILSGGRRRMEPHSSRGDTPPGCLHTYTHPPSCRLPRQMHGTMLCSCPLSSSACSLTCHLFFRLPPPPGGRLGPGVPPPTQTAAVEKDRLSCVAYLLHLYPLLPTCAFHVFLYSLKRKPNPNSLLFYQTKLLPIYV